MSGNEQETNTSEIVIIRRRGGAEDEGHHGGAWKIAYADFVTAMMTFFLVMWLINSTPSKTLVQIASYFNPVRLTNKVATTKGLEDAGAGHGPEREVNQTTEKKPPPGGEGQQTGLREQREAALFREPYATLDELAERALQEEPTLAGDQESANARASRGEAYRDPFDPAFRLEVQRRPMAMNEAGPGAKEAPQSEPATARPESTPARNEARPAAADTTSGQAPEASAKATAVPDEGQHKAEAARIEAEIRSVLGGVRPALLPDIEVKATEEGVLVSLTDKYDFGMFAVASAEPRPATVAVMAKIASIVGARQESLIVRGHTDGRRYRSSSYDNWRLSTARAHMAYYMLVRGGIPEARFERVEGYADHALKVPSDPGAAQNRRIEILLRAQKR